VILPEFCPATLVTVRAVLPADMEALMKPRTDAEVIARRLFDHGYRPAAVRDGLALGVAVARVLSGTGIALTATDAVFATIRSDLERLTEAAIANRFDRDHEAAVRTETGRFMAQTRPLSTAAE
jgi:hypothetical protein